jgi:hypothetical protein
MRRLSTDDELLLEGRENRLILSIETMKEKYFANFTCQADNEMGRSAATLPLSGEDLKGQCREIILFEKNIHSFVVVVATMEIMYGDENSGFFTAVYERICSKIFVCIIS